MKIEILTLIVQAVAVTATLAVLVVNYILLRENIEYMRASRKYLEDQSVLYHEELKAAKGRLNDEREEARFVREFMQAIRTAPVRPAQQEPDSEL
ncbi:hypothetical protein AB0H98_01930 [Nocardia salmonicida]|uniref:hypothetical protein n=1 Tax=Nocardia salmonicida TaxID=53431 RepID=UPI0033E3BCD1